MKRSKQVPATLITGLAAGLAAGGCGCGGSYYSQCQDAYGRPIPDSYCTGGGYYGGSYYGGAHWVHVQRSGFGSSYGGSGGSFGG